MRPELTNLLPEERARLLTRGYYLRLATLATVFVILIVLVNAFLLLPSYVLIKSQNVAKENELTALESAGASAGTASFAGELSAFTKHAETLVALQATALDIPLLSEVLSVAHPGVSLTSFSFTPATASVGAIISITGMADTRDDLRAYDLALSGAPFAASVNLPVSDYAAENNLPFTLTLTLTSP